MATANRWGAPRIHGELKKLGYDITERTVSNYMPNVDEPTTKAVIENWKKFFKNHSEFIIATDFFTVPTAFFRDLYIFFIIHHGSRRIIHVNATYNPTEQWIIQQFREAFPGEINYRHLILDRDKKFSPEVKKSN